MENIIGWYLKGIHYDQAPASLQELQAQGLKVELPRADLLPKAKWEPLLQGRRHTSVPGWIALEDIASFRRGIATGANGFFLLSLSQLHSLGISRDRCFPCVGRAIDVRGLIYTQDEFDRAVSAGSKLYLLNLSDPLTDAERQYVKSGEEQGLTSRFLLKSRRPWYSMEQRGVAPIWSAVFGRGDLKFVYNSAGVRSLTNFHCIYPKSDDAMMHKALTLSLNTATSRESSKLHGRVYGGGLNKFEPNDLKSIQVPDLQRVPNDIIVSMGELLASLNAKPHDRLLQKEADDLCVRAGEAAARSQP